MTTADYDNLPAEETREIVTPFAFKVAPELLGKPLAKPGRRGLAIIIDLLLISLLAALSSSLLLFMLAFLLWRLSRPQGGTVMLAPIRFSVRIIALLLMIVVALSWFGAVFQGGISKQVDAFLEARQDLAKDNDVADQNLLKTMRNTLDVLGIGVGWSGVYFTFFVAFWSGQTPGKRLLSIRVVKLNNEPMSLWESFERYGGYGAGLATGLLGFLQIYWDPNRQAMHDRIASTVVLDLRKEGKAD